MIAHDPDLATCVTAVDVDVAVLGLRGSQRQRLRQFEKLYVQRYWTLMDRLSLVALRGQSIQAVSDEDEKIVLAYLRLCEDQLELRRAGWISDSTWIIWAIGIRSQLARRPFKEVWRQVYENGADFTPLHDFHIEKFDDPCHLS